MLITGTRSKYYVLSVLGALVLAVGVLAVAPSAQAQEIPPQPTIDKECTPNPVQIGQTLTCTIDVEAAPGTGALLQVEDTLPAGLTVRGATSEVIVAFDGVVDEERTSPVPCTVAGNTVTCPPDAAQLAQIFNRVFQGRRITATFRVTIEARAERCGTFPNTARAEGIVFVEGGVERAPVDVADTELITVEGCEEEEAGGVGGGGAAPITQEGEQESEAGEIDQTFEVS